MQPGLVLGEKEENQAERRSKGCGGLWDGRGPCGEGLREGQPVGREHSPSPDLSPTRKARSGSLGGGVKRS